MRPERILLYVALLASTVIGALAIASTLHAKDWEPGSKEALLFSFGTLLFIGIFIMIPILIVIDTHLKEKQHG